ncbi:hypothetical protein FGIG_10801, partial [Fasciola gigantica]
RIFWPLPGSKLIVLLHPDFFLFSQHLAFEIELEMDRDHWAFEATAGENLYSGWSPICDQLIDATVPADDVIRGNLMGCRSSQSRTKTQLTVYMALPLAYLTTESITPCKTKYFAQWKIAISKHFEVHADNVQFLYIYREGMRIRLFSCLAITILGNVKKRSEVFASSDLFSEQDETDLRKLVSLTG